MINYKQLITDFDETALTEYADYWQRAVEQKMQGFTHGYTAQWQKLMDDLPVLSGGALELKASVGIGDAQLLDQQLNSAEKSKFVSALKTLSPWRKGPFDLYGIHIDTEWRSDWKWDRLLPHISPLKDRTVIDVGCGNGYHCWRMLGEGAKAVLGIDPTQKFLAQFGVMKRYLGAGLPVHLLPLGIEDMPKIKESEGVDTVFSMGVLYQRTGRFTSAKSFFEKALSIRPENAYARYNLASLYDKEFENPNKALRLYYEVVQSSDKTDEIKELALIQIQGLRDSRISLNK